MCKSEIVKKSEIFIKVICKWIQICKKKGSLKHLHCECYEKDHLGPSWPDPECTYKTFSEKITVCTPCSIHERFCLKGGEIGSSENFEWSLKWSFHHGNRYKTVFQIKEIVSSLYSFYSNSRSSEWRRSGVLIVTF